MVFIQRGELSIWWIFFFFFIHKTALLFIFIVCLHKRLSFPFVAFKYIRTWVSNTKLQLKNARFENRKEFCVTFKVINLKIAIDFRLEYLKSLPI